MTVLSSEDNVLSCGQKKAGNDSLARCFEEVIGSTTRPLDVTVPENLTTAPPLGSRRM